MLSLPENSQAQACSVVDCRRCWLHLCKVTTVLYHIFPNGRAIIGFNHGLPWCVKYMALGPPVATKPSGFAVGFCGDRRPSCHVFHTSRQAMIKTYNKPLPEPIILSFCRLEHWGQMSMKSKLQYKTLFQQFRIILISHCFRRKNDLHVYAN